MSALKRKRPGSVGSSGKQNPDELNIYNLIKSKGGTGILKGDIKKELNMTNVNIVDKCVKSLLSKQKIKEVANVQAKGKKRLMAMEFEPSKELTGGVWYNVQGKLDLEKIQFLKEKCLKKLSTQKVATADGICHSLRFNSVEQVKEILDYLVLEEEDRRLSV